MNRCPGSSKDTGLVLNCKPFELCAVYSTDLEMSDLAVLTFLHRTSYFAS